MRIDPAMQALRGDPAPQRHAQAQLQAARERLTASALWRDLAGALEAYGAGTPLEDCKALARLFAEPSCARGFADDLSEAFATALRAAPLGHVPFRHGCDGGLSTLLLGEAGRASLLLVAQEPGRFSPRTASFSHGERHDVVLAGRAHARIIRKLAQVDGLARLEEEDFGLSGNVLFSLALEQESLVLDMVSQRLVSLRLRRSAPVPQPMREYRLADGALVRQAAGDPGESRLELMLALLGRMGRADAASIMVGISRSGSDHLRWQALRECLALDSAQGFAALSRIAADPLDSLASPAGALRAQLLETYPALGRLENA